MADSLQQEKVEAEWPRAWLQSSECNVRKCMDNFESCEQLWNELPDLSVQADPICTEFRPVQVAWQVVLYR